jgi:hypothetical protein
MLQDMLLLVGRQYGNKLASLIAVWQAQPAYLISRHWEFAPPFSF